MLRIVLFREGPCWLAQCLEHDFGSQGPTLVETLARLVAVADRLAALDRLTTLDPAPSYFQTLWPLRAGDFAPQDAVLGGWGAGMRFGVAA